MKQLENFSNVKVLVVGDVMLDRYWWGSVNRISPEAPVPVVHLQETSLVAGGAANVAVNIAGLTAEAFLVGMIGDDKEAELFSPLLNNSKISTDYLIKLPNRQTTVKTRVVAHSQQVVRIDQESKLSLSNLEEDRIWEKIKNLIEKIDLIVVSDYNKGFLTKKILKRLITTAIKYNKIVLVDPKGKNYNKYQGATILTPNLREIAEACGMDEFAPNILERAGKQLLASLKIKALLITQGEEGMTLLEKDKQSIHLAARARKVYDVTGAGDTVIATLAVAMGAGMSLEKSSNAANVAAGIVVEQMGTSSISFDLLKNSLNILNDFSKKSFG
jgi:D-beta-D-heptose 7-phosphate kinase/D-beta-D-heptose 1-phosphate adenosyltransferase